MIHQCLDTNAQSFPFAAESYAVASKDAGLLIGVAHFCDSVAHCCDSAVHFFGEAFFLVAFFFVLFLAFFTALGLVAFLLAFFAAFGMIVRESLVLANGVGSMPPQESVHTRDLGCAFLCIAPSHITQVQCPGQRSGWRSCVQRLCREMRTKGPAWCLSPGETSLQDFLV